MPRLTEVRERLHKPLWDTLIAMAEDLPCDAWVVTDLIARPSSPLAPLGTITRSEYVHRYVPPDIEAVIWIRIPHEYPAIRPLEVKHTEDIAGWTTVIDDFWRQLVDLHDFAIPVSENSAAGVFGA